MPKSSSSFISHYLLSLTKHTGFTSQAAISMFPILCVWCVFAYTYKSYVKCKKFESNINSKYSQIPFNVYRSRRRCINFSNKQIYSVLKIFLKLNWHTLFEHKYHILFTLPPPSHMPNMVSGTQWILKKSLLNNSMNSQMQIGHIKSSRCYDIEISYFTLMCNISRNFKCGMP